jgi:hypothetical protein
VSPKQSARHQLHGTGRNKRALELHHPAIHGGFDGVMGRGVKLRTSSKGFNADLNRYRRQEGQ